MLSDTLAGGGISRRIGLDELAGDEFGNPGDVLRLGTLVHIVRRHVAGVDAVHDLLPVAHDLRGIEIDHQVVHPQIALLLLLAVTLRAVLLKERADDFLEIFLRLRGGVGRRDASGQQRQTRRGYRTEGKQNATMHGREDTREGRFLGLEDEALGSYGLR